MAKKDQETPATPVMSLAEFLDELPTSQSGARAMFRHAAGEVLEMKPRAAWQAAFDRFMSAPVGTQIQW